MQVARNMRDTCVIRACYVRAAGRYVRVTLCIRVDQLRTREDQLCTRENQLCTPGKPIV